MFRLVLTTSLLSLHVLSLAHNLTERGERKRVKVVVKVFIKDQKGVK